MFYTKKLCTLRINMLGEHWEPHPVEHLCGEVVAGWQGRHPPCWTWCRGDIERKRSLLLPWTAHFAKECIWVTGAKKQIAHRGESKVWWIEHWTMSPKDLATVPGSVTDSFCDLEEVIQLSCAFDFLILKATGFSYFFCILLILRRIFFSVFVWLSDM